MNSKSLVGVLAFAATAILLAGCGGTSIGAGSSPPSRTTSQSAVSVHNDADTSFVRGMVPHHVQAVEMADAAAERAENTQVKQLAGRIRQAQDPEIVQMRGLLAAWGEPETAATAPSGSIGGTDHGSMGHGSGTGAMSGMSGMMTDQQMLQLGQATGAEFDRMFLQMTVEHHTGAVAMVQTEIADG